MDEALGEQMSKYVSNFRFFFATIFSWFLKSQNLLKDKKDNFKRALIISLIKCSIIDPYCLKLTKESASIELATVNIKEIDINNYGELKNLFYQQSTDYSVFVTSLLIKSSVASKEYMKELKLKLNGFTTAQTVNLHLVHNLCEFQAFYLSIVYVQELLDAIEPKTKNEPNTNQKSLDMIKMQYFFNASFLHNFIENLDHRVNPDLYVEEFLGRKSFFKFLYNDLLKLYDDMFQ